jgi:hypothetical protein
LTRLRAVVDEAGEATVFWEKRADSGVTICASRTRGGAWQTPVSLLDARFPTMMEVTGDVTVNDEGDVLCVVQADTGDGRKLHALRYYAETGWAEPEALAAIEPDDIGIASVGLRGSDEIVAMNAMLPSLNLSFTTLWNGGTAWGETLGIPDDWFVQCNQIAVHGDDILVVFEARDASLAYQGIWAAWLEEEELCGDFDDDNDVDYDDYVIFLDAFGGPVDGNPQQDAECDYDDSGAVGMADYAAWLSCYRDFVGNPLAGPPARPTGIEPGNNGPKPKAKSGLSAPRGKTRPAGLRSR